MRVKNDISSPWGKRVWFEDHEFEEMMDEARARAGSDVFQEGAGVDLEAILERGYGIVPDYADLPSGILGQTLFHRDGRCEVLLSRRLAEAAEHDIVSRRRLRTTTAHETAHVVEHAHFHVTDTGTLSLFDEPKDDIPRVLCREGVIESSKVVQASYDGEWWEYQANRGMASLLLPRHHLADCLQRLLSSRGFENIREAMAVGRTEEIVREIMLIFDVNMPVVLYRLQELGSLPKNAGQTALDLDENRKN
jgi:hypothetical protein